MQPSAEIDNESEDQCKDYAYDEIDYEDSDSETNTDTDLDADHDLESELEEGEIYESPQNKEENTPVTLEESMNYMNNQLETCRVQTTWKQYFPYPNQPQPIHLWLNFNVEDLLA